MNWRGFLWLGAVAAALVILVLAAIDGDWLGLGIILVLAIGVLLFEVYQAKRRARFR